MLPAIFTWSKRKTFLSNFGSLYLHIASEIFEVGSVDKVADEEEHSGGDEQVEEVEALEY